MKIVFLRHGDALNASGGYFGRTDNPLTEVGRKQATARRDALADYAPDSVWISPARRVRETAELALSPVVFASAVVDSDLREINFGDWEGKTFREICAEDPEKVNAWAALSPDFRFPGGESVAEFEERIHRLTARIRSAKDVSRLLVVTHGGIIRYLLCDLLRLDFSHVWIFSIPPGSLVRLNLADGYAQLEALQDGR